MNNDLSSYFEDPEFKDLLAKYEGMAESHTPTYFDAEELTDIAEYYAMQGDEQKAEEAIDFALRLHPNNTDALVFKSRSLCIKGQLSEAYQIMNLIEDPSDREVQFLKADLLMEEHRLEEAEDIYLELARSEDESFEVLLDIALTYMDANRKANSYQWLEKIRQKGINEKTAKCISDMERGEITSDVENVIFTTIAATGVISGISELSCLSRFLEMPHEAFVLPAVVILRLKSRRMMSLN